MNRKVTLHGPATLSVSLPLKWARKYGVKKGSEINVEEKGPVLEVSAKRTFNQRNISFDVEDIDRTTLIYYLRYCYRNGIDTISLKFNELGLYHHRYKKEVNVSKIIEEEVNRLMGMEIIEQKMNYCMIKCMVHENMEDFDVFLRKIFHLISDSIAQMSNLEKDKNSLQEIKHNHDTLTRFVSYCTRLMKKFGYYDYDKTMFMHSMLEALETMMDIIEDVAIREDIESIRVSKEEIKIILQLKDFFREFVEYYYTFSTKKAAILNTKRIELTQLCNKLSPKDKQIIGELLTILVIVRNIIGVRTGLEG